LLWCGGLRVEADTLNPSFLRVPLMLHMRREIKDVNSTTLCRLDNRRLHQKQILALDYELFRLTQDTTFALSVNDTHRRQAKALRMKGVRHLHLNEHSSDPRRNPNHPLHESFVRVCDDADEDTLPSHLGKKASGEAAKEGDQAEYAIPHGLLDSEEDEEEIAERLVPSLRRIARRRLSPDSTGRCPGRP